MPKSVFESIVVRRLAAVLLLAIMVVCPVGCSSEKQTSPPLSSTAPSFTRANYLRGTVGSMVRIRGFEPQLVSGYGLIILPPGSHTGSSQVPPYLSQRLINDMRKRGLGSSRLGTLAMSPARVLADLDTVVVVVRGFVPAGAVAGTRFDVIVSVLDTDTDATSLGGGRLWTVDLAQGGANKANRYSHLMAEARGPAYVNPFDARPADEQELDFRRHALVIAGGKATTARPVQLILNQPSWSRSALIADRIIARFGKTTDARLLAEPKTDLIINLNIPPRYAADPGQLIDLIQHLYVPTGGGFEAHQAVQLAKQIEKHPGKAGIVRAVTLCWQAMGRTVIPVLRTYYDAERVDMRLAALNAGSWLGDERAGKPLVELTTHPSPAMRIAAVEALVHLPRNIQAIAALNRLLDDDDRTVRIAAYETLAANNDPLIERMAVEDDQGIKYLIDRVSATKPLVYVTSRDFPRLVIFDSQLGFDSPFLSSLWQSRLMMRVEQGENELLHVYYRPAHRTGETQKLQAIPTVATLAYLLGHQPSLDRPQNGLDLTFGQVAETMYHLCQEGTIPAPIQIRVSPLARLIDNAPRDALPERPETAPQPQTTDPSTTEVSLRAEIRD